VVRTSKAAIASLSLNRINKDSERGARFLPLSHCKKTAKKKVGFIFVLL
jgi:hypothetical protein